MLRITQKGLNRIEKHLDNILKQEDILIEVQAGERAMLERLRLGHTTQQDIEFFLHELKESAIFRRTGDLEKAHQEALKWGEVTEQDLFHPDVIRQRPDLFNPAWR